MLYRLIVNQTSLNLVNEGGDIVYSGEIVEYSVTPMAATAEIKAAQNRLTMAVMVSYENVRNEKTTLKKGFLFIMIFQEIFRFMIFEILLWRKFLKE